MAVHLDVIWIPSIGDILLGSGGADTWLRIGLLIGIVAGIVYKLISLFDKKGFAACGAAALLGTLTNTGLVMGGIYLIFGHQYAEAVNVAFDMLGTFIMGIVATNGLAEAAVAVVLCVLIIRPLMKALNRNNTAKTESSALSEESDSTTNN